MSTPPIVLFYGANDPFYRQDVREFVAAAKKVGAEVKLLAWPRVGHGFFNREPYLSKTLKAPMVKRVRHGNPCGKMDEPVTEDARRRHRAAHPEDYALYEYAVETWSPLWDLLG